MKFGIFVNFNKKEARAIFPEVVNYFLKKGVDVICNLPRDEDSPLEFPDVPAFSLNELARRCDIMITLGGDGTILTASRHIMRNSVAVLGVHMGGLGFLAELSPENLFPSLDKLLQGEYSIQERMVIKGIVVYENETKEFFAINDLVIDKGRSLRMLKIRTFLDQAYLHTYRADGLIIATPTGSTAYSLSSGGPILVPSLDAMVITPISPHSLTARPVVVPADQKVRIICENSGMESFLIADGQEQVSLGGIRYVDIVKADFPFRMVKIGEKTFFETLRAKLNWGRDVRGN